MKTQDGWLFNPECDNFRPPQKLNKRKVEVFESKKKKKKSEDKESKKDDKESESEDAKSEKEDEESEDAGSGNVGVENVSGSGYDGSGDH